jgi:hypothetical protein
VAERVVEHHPIEAAMRVVVRRHPQLARHTTVAFGTRRKSEIRVFCFPPPPTAAADRVEMAVHDGSADFGPRARRPKWWNHTRDA